jgi:hypothetical protein
MITLCGGKRGRAKTGYVRIFMVFSLAASLINAAIDHWHSLSTVLIGTAPSFINTSLNVEWKALYTEFEGLDRTVFVSAL